jgi:transcription initiation factor IIE alpha subunit
MPTYICPVCKSRVTLERTAKYPLCPQCDNELEEEKPEAEQDGQ